MFAIYSSSASFCLQREGKTLNILHFARRMQLFKSILRYKWTNLWVVQETSTGRYKYYIAIELDGEKIVKDYYKALSKNDKIMVDYNYEKFKETFEKEMENQR